MELRPDTSASPGEPSTGTHLRVHPRAHNSWLHVGPSLTTATLFACRQHACRACGGIGVFPCRHGLGVMRGNSCLFLICKRCSQLASVQRRLVQDGLHVDLFGLSGQKLLPAKKQGAAVNGWM